MKSLRQLIVLFFALQCAQAAHLNLLLAAEGTVLVFGRAQDDPVRAIRDRQEFVDYVAKKLAPVGITGGKILVVDTYFDQHRPVMRGDVRFFDCPAHKGLGQCDHITMIELIP